MKMATGKFAKLLVLMIAAAPLFTRAQTVQGRWYGVGFIDIAETTNSYLCELVLQEKSGAVTGQFNYYFRNAFLSNDIKGNFSSDNRFLYIQFVPVMYNKTTNTLIGVDCPRHGEFLLKIARTETTLAGNFLSDDLHKYTCAALKITFRKEADDEPTLKQRVDEMAKEDYLEPDTVLPVAVAVKPPPPSIDSAAIKLEADAVKAYHLRTNQLARILDISDDSARVDLYDNGELDYDTITVFYNQHIVKYRQMLDTRKPITFYAHVDSNEANNELVMYADNLGLIPPNSAIMIVTDKGHRYEVSLNSDYQKNAAVRLRRMYKAAGK